VALQYRRIRAAATAVVIAAAVGAGGMTGMTSTLAADPTVPLTGTLVDGAGKALGGIELVLTEELAPDGGNAAFHATTAADGSFSVALYPWGTTETPATLSIVTGPEQELTVIGEECSQTWSVTAAASHELALGDAEPAPLEPLGVTATTALIGEVCAVAATPRPNSGTGGANLTPPPTDTGLVAGTGSPDRLGVALLLGFAIGLAAVVGIVTPRPGTRRRD
jgi:hypothetical protein